MSIKRLVSGQEGIVATLLVTEVSVTAGLYLIWGAVPVAVSAVGVGEELVGFGLSLNVLPASA